MSGRVISVGSHVTRSRSDATATDPTYPIPPGHASPASSCRTKRTEGNRAHPKVGLRRLARAGDAEGVARGVGEHHPAEVVADAVPTDLGRSRRREPAHLGVDVGGAEIQMHPVLAGRGIVHLLE